MEWGKFGATGSRCGITSCPTSPGPPAHGGCHFWFIDAEKLCQSPCPTSALAGMAAGQQARSRLDFGIASTLSTSLCLARPPQGWEGLCRSLPGLGTPSQQRDPPTWQLDPGWARDTAGSASLPSPPSLGQCCTQGAWPAVGERGIRDVNHRALEWFVWEGTLRII